MKRWVHTLLLACCTATTVYAAPPEIPTVTSNTSIAAPVAHEGLNKQDGIDRFLAEKSGQIKTARQTVAKTAMTVADRTSDIVLNAMGFLGVPYRRGGNSAETGFDCSGFVRALFQQTVGLVLPRIAKQQADVTKTIEKNDLRPGDLVFFNTMRRTFSHVGIYIGDNKFIHSPRSGSEIRIEDMNMSYWQQRFNGARRVDMPEDSKDALYHLSQAVVLTGNEASAANPRVEFNADMLKNISLATPLNASVKDKNAAPLSLSNTTTPAKLGE